MNQFVFGRNNNVSDGIKLAAVSLNNNKNIIKTEGNNIEKIPDQEEEIVVDLNYILDEKPNPKIVRNFLKENIKAIRSDEDILFED